MDSNEIYTTALNNALDEMRKVCPDIQHAFIYNENGELIAGDTETPQKVTTRVIDAFDDILERAEAIGGVEAITINGDMGTVKLYHFNEHYLVAVYSAKAEVGYVDTIVRVLVPTVLKVLEKLSPTPLKNVAEPKPEPLGLEKPQEGELTEKPVEKLPAESKPEAEPSLASEKLQEPPSPLEVPAVQLIVENIGGLLVPSDTVRVDSETLSSWENAFLHPPKLHLSSHRPQRPLKTHRICHPIIISPRSRRRTLRNLQPRLSQKHSRGRQRS